MLPDNINRFGLWRRLRASTGFQVLLILAFWQLGQGIVRWLRLPVPGAVVAMALLLVLLGTKVMEPRTLQRGASWFLAELVLFLLPSVLSLCGHPEFLGRLGLKVLAAILVGTLVVMMVTALVVDVGYRWLVRSKGRTA